MQRLSGTGWQRPAGRGAGWLVSGAGRTAQCSAGGSIAVCVAAGRWDDISVADVPSGDGIQSYDQAVARCNPHADLPHELCASPVAFAYAAGVLANLLCMQQLDQHDIEGIYLLYQALLQHGGHGPQLHSDKHSTAQQHSADQPAASGTASTQGADGGGGTGPDHMSSLLPALEHAGCGQRRHKCSAARRLAELAQCEAARDALLVLPPAEAHAALRDYMTAVTAKDCSVMVTMRRAAQGGNTAGCGGSKDACGGDVQGVVTIGLQRFEYKVGLPYHFSCPARRWEQAIAKADGRLNAQLG